MNLKINNKIVASYILQPTVEALLATRKANTGRYNQMHLELLDFIIYEPELSDRLLNDLVDIFKSVDEKRMMEEVLV